MTWMVLLASACNTPLPKGVIRIPAGEAPTHIEGPMPEFGPFKKYSEALMAACPRILSLPNAVSVKENNPNFKLHWTLSTEYCAWIYYTPDEQYEMSMVATSMSQTDPRMRTCDLPSFVHDSRYPDEALGYVFVVHNHPVGNPLSPKDVRFIVQQAEIHGASVKMNEREVPLGIVAFYSHGEPDQPTCDGFFQYTPLSGELLKWNRSGRGEWTKGVYGSVKWKSDGDFDFELQ